MTMNIGRIIQRTALLLLLCVVSVSASAQRLSVRTNTLAWATLSPNAGFELTLSNRMSVVVNGSFNAWNSTQFQAKHISLSAEVRYWFIRPSISHFAAVGPTATTYNLRLGGQSYMGDLYAFGVGYGYSLPLSKRWNFEPQIMVGYGRLKEYTAGDVRHTPARTRWVPMVTQVGLNFVYVIK